MSPNRGRKRRNRPAPRQHPLPGGDTFYTPHAGPLRHAVERHSAAPLLLLHNAPRWILPVTMAAVFITGLLVAGVVGAILLAALGGFFGWLAFLAWPNLRSGDRAMRVIVILILVSLGVLQSGIF